MIPSMAKNELIQRIDIALNSIRDYLRSDGGDIRIHDVREDMVLEVELLGNCESCSMSNTTMKLGIEQVVKKTVPEIVKVVAINN